MPQLCPSVIDILQAQARMAEGPSDLYVHIPILPKSVWLMCRLHYNEHALPAFFSPKENIVLEHILATEPIELDIVRDWLRANMN